MTNILHYVDVVKSLEVSNCPHVQSPPVRTVDSTHDRPFPSVPKISVSQNSWNFLKSASLKLTFSGEQQELVAKKPTRVSEDFITSFAEYKCYAGTLSRQV